MIKVLIAEDFSLLLEDLEEVINKQPDMKVAGSAQSGKAIVQLAREIPFDIILMDIEMEHMTSGIDAAREIREFNKKANIIYLTAHGTKDVIITAMATGAVDYIVKGASEEEILLHIRSAYRERPLMDSRIQDIIMQEYKRLQQSEKSLLFFIHNVSDLTAAEREIIRYLLNGLKVKDIAKERSVEIVTIKTQISTILKKFGESRTKAIVKKIKELNIAHLF